MIPSRNGGGYTRQNWPRNLGDETREKHPFFIMETPPLTLTFSLPTEEEHDGFDWSHVERDLLKKMKISEAHQQELRRTLFANSFQSGSYLLCSFEAIYSIARLFFAFAPDLDRDQWPLVANATKNNPIIILAAIGLPPLEFALENTFCFFSLEGIATGLSPSIQTVVEADRQFREKYIVNDQ